MCKCPWPYSWSSNHKQKWEKSQEMNKSQSAGENVFHLFKNLKGPV